MTERRKEKRKVGRGRSSLRQVESFEEEKRSRLIDLNKDVELNLDDDAF